MRYTEEELRNCLERRLKWYEEALEYKNKYKKNGDFPPIGFTFPDGNFRVWEGAVRELKNTLDMMKCDSENEVSENKTAKIYIEVDGGLVSNVYTDSKVDLEVILCDYDMAEGEEEGDGYNFQSTKACDELEEIKEGLKHIF